MGIILVMLCGCTVQQKEWLPGNEMNEEFEKEAEIEDLGGKTDKGRSGGLLEQAEGEKAGVDNLQKKEKNLRMKKQWSEKLYQERIRQLLETADPLPKRYDAREEGRTAPVEDQRELGTCWAFSSLTALENAMLPQEIWDFSEDHMSHNPYFILGQENGGEYTMSMAYLLSWRGPVTEAQDPYGDGVSPEGLKPVKHVQEVRILPEKDQETIKRAVLACGGVQSSLYTTMQNGDTQSEYYNPQTSAYCYPDSTAPNHDVVIVGWDDDFPAEAFRPKAKNNGAFLCENSWGTEFGDGGFFYVSYEDANLGKTNIVYTCIEEPDNYDSLYQSDHCGWVGQLGYGEEMAWAANIYTAKYAEAVKAVGFYTVDENTEYQIYLLRHVPENPKKALKQRGEILAEGKLRHAGYYTIPLEKSIPVEAGERFAVVIHLMTPEAIHPIAVEYDAGDGKCQIDLKDGEGYISFEGEYWENVEEQQSCNICLKAYTDIR